MPVPLTSAACTIRGLEVAVPGRPAAETWLWECSPGRFEPDAAGEPAVEFRAGDTLFFPPETRGVWEIREAVRKVYVML